MVENEPLWFESADTVLEPALEAFGSALLLGAARHKRRLEFPAPPDPQWLANISRVLSIASEWWDYPRPRASESPSPVPPQALEAPGPAAALGFSGGVDSFYSLLRSGETVRTLVFVVGYDMPLSDTARANAAERSIRAVASALGIQAVVIRTNLREHPVLRQTCWDHIHGGALAAIGHLLTRSSRRFLISASYPRVFDRPWGSHWKLDPWWSSSRLDLVHVGAEKWRSEKLLDLVDAPLVRQHLRVCWENRSIDGNCGQCEKCLRTMLILDGHGRLDQFPVFPNAITLAGNISQLPSLRHDLLPVYGEFMKSDLSPAVRQAVSSLLDRSRPKPARSWWRIKPSHA